MNASCTDHARARRYRSSRLASRVIPCSSRSFKLLGVENQRSRGQAGPGLLVVKASTRKMRTRLLIDRASLAVVAAGISARMLPRRAARRGTCKLRGGHG